MIPPKVSVIVAVYNAAPYLRRCLDSLKAQTLKEFDVIIIDDGSTDQSLQICQEYAERDTRFRVYHQENAGISSARQYGVQQLIDGGTYSIHVDPDDWAEPTMLETLYQKAQETHADIIMCDFLMDYPDKTIYTKQDPKTEKPLHVLHALLRGQLYGSLWNKLIRSACYKEYNIRFPEKLNYCEDYYVVSALLQHADKVVYHPEALYHYDRYSNHHSLSRTQDKQTIARNHEELVKKERQQLLRQTGTWHYHQFEINKAFNIIVQGDMDRKKFCALFNKIPAITLLHPHRHYMRTIAVCLYRYGNIPKHPIVTLYNTYITIKNRTINITHKNQTHLKPKHKKKK